MAEFTPLRADCKRCTYSEHDTNGSLSPTCAMIPTRMNRTKHVESSWRVTQKIRHHQHAQREYGTARSSPAANLHRVRSRVRAALRESSCSPSCGAGERRSSAAKLAVAPASDASQRRATSMSTHRHQQRRAPHRPSWQPWLVAVNVHGLDALWSTRRGAVGRHDVA